MGSKISGIGERVEIPGLLHADDLVLRGELGVLLWCLGEEV